MAYFYCDYHAFGNKNATTEIASAILRQMVEAEKDIPAPVKDLHKTLGEGRIKLKLDDITTVIHRLGRLEPNYYIIVDAIDECRSHRKSVLQFLKKLSDASAQVMISGRSHVPDIGRIFDLYSQLEIKAMPSDIRLFIEWMIASSDELSDLIPNDAKQEIVQRLIDQSSGMFLIAKLKCIHLTHLSRFSEIKKAVRTPPQGLDDLYKESMHRITSQPPAKKTTAMKTLSWIYHAKRQLSIEELVHALAIESDEPIPAYEDVISDKAVLDMCAGLVLIDAENNTARFVHHTLQEYFDSTYESWFIGARLDITKACLTYLRLLSPQRSIADSIALHPFLKYAAAYWGSHVRDEYHEDLDGIALAALRDNSVLEKISDLMNNEHKTVRMAPSPNLAIQMSARFGAVAVLKLLLRHNHSIEGADPMGRTPLHWAARGGFADVVQILLREGIEPSPRTTNGMTPFHWAAKHGHATVIEELMSRTNPAEATLDGRTALHWASSQGHISVVTILLSDKRVDIGCRSQNGWTPLHWAAVSTT